MPSFFLLSFVSFFVFYLVGILGVAVLSYSCRERKRYASISLATLQNVHSCHQSVVLTLYSFHYVLVRRTTISHRYIHNGPQFARRANASNAVSMDDGFASACKPEKNKINMRIACGRGKEREITVNRERQRDRGGDREREREERKEREGR